MASMQEIIDFYIREMRRRTEEVIMEALDHFQVNLEDIPSRCKRKEHHGYTEYLIDGKLALTVDMRDINRWVIEKHY
jgi:hypothetical protein